MQVDILKSHYSIFLKVTLNDMLDDYAEAAKLGKVLYVTLLIHIIDVYIHIYIYKYIYIYIDTGCQAHYSIY